jgi:UDP-3-O-[3-hydroxymyristoyl] glucosamine N-acyltransferase
MADRRFFAPPRSLTLAALVEATGAKLSQGADPERSIGDVAALETAGPDDLSFLDNRAYLEAFRSSRAGTCLVQPKYAEQAPAGMTLLLSEEPYKAYALAAQALYPEQAPEPGISPAAHVDATARLAEGVALAAGVTLGPAVEIGARTNLGANTTVAAGVVVGADCAIAANVTLSHCLIGDRVRLHPGVRIGQDGFGFAPDPAGHVKVPQLGRVIVHDDVEMGANCTVDRGSGPDTIIGAGCWFDNLVQIAHNVELGRGCIMVAQSGISGSCKLGDFVVVGGQVGIAGHLSIGSGARIAAKSGLMRDVAAGDTVGGYPAQPIRDWHRQTASLRRLAGATGKAAGKTTRETQAKGNK